MQTQDYISESLNNIVDWEDMPDISMAIHDMPEIESYVHSTVTIGPKTLLIGRMRFPNFKEWLNVLWDDGANVNLFDNSLIEKYGLKTQNTGAVVQGIGGKQSSLQVAPVTVHFETKDGEYVQQLYDNKTSELNGAFQAIIGREVRHNKQLNNTLDFHVDYPTNTIFIDQRHELVCNRPINEVHAAAAWYTDFRSRNACFFDSDDTFYINPCDISSPDKHMHVEMPEVVDNIQNIVDDVKLNELLYKIVEAKDKSKQNKFMEEFNQIGLQSDAEGEVEESELLEHLDLEAESTDSAAEHADSVGYKPEYLATVYAMETEQYGTDKCSKDPTADTGHWMLFPSKDGMSNYVAHVETVEQVKSNTTYVKPQTFEKNIKNILAHKELVLPKHLQPKFVTLLKKHIKMTTLPTAHEALGPLNTKENLIIREKDNADPVSKRPYPFGPAEMRELQLQLQFLLAKGYIRPSKSPYGAPVLFAPKADGGLRMAIDYRQLNAQTIDDNYGLPKIADIFDQVAGNSHPGAPNGGRAQYFSTIDLVWAYWQIKVAESSIEKLAITTPMGAYDFLVAPFGVKQMPSTFQRIVEGILRPYLTRFCMVYLDDVIIYSNTAEEHLEHITMILDALDKANFRIKLEKCSFFLKNVKLLGWYIGRDGRKADPKKVQAIQQYKRPETFPQMARFLGAVGHIRDVIPECSRILAPLTESTKGKDIRKTTERNGIAEKVTWTKEMLDAFEEIKKVLTSAPVLQLIDPTQPFFLKCDASDLYISASLFQHHEKKLHPVQYFSRKLSDTETRWHIIEKEALSMVEPLRKWDKYLASPATVVVLGDSKPVEAITKMKNPKPKHLRWLLDLQGINYEYQHIKGETNVFSDAFTRQEHVAFTDDCSIDDYVTSVFMLRDLIHKALEEASQEYNQESKKIQSTADQTNVSIGRVFIAPVVETEPEQATAEASEMLTVTPVLALKHWFDKIEQSYAQDELAQNVLKKSRADLPSEYTQYRTVDGIIYYFPVDQTKPRSIYVPNDIELRISIIEAHHDTAFSQHFDAKRTIEKVARHFYWPTLKIDVEQHIKACKNCLRGKYRTQPKSAISIPMDIPAAPWLLIGADAKTGLPRTQRGNDMFWMICDYFTGKMHILPGRKEGMTAEKLAHMFLREVFRHHGLPLKIITDRDPLFSSEFWQTFWKTLTTILNMSTARNPWTDGKSERYIRTAVELFRTFCMDHPRDWDIYAPAVEFAFNDTVDPMRGISPFKADTLGEPHTPISLLIRRFRLESGLYEEDPSNPLSYIDKYSKVMADIRNKLTKISHDRQKLLRKRGYKPLEFRPSDQVMIENPHAVNDRKKLAALEERYSGPFTLENEVGNNRWSIKEWREDTARHPVVNASKFKPVGRPLGEVDESEDEELAELTPIPLEAPAPIPVTRVPELRTTYPRVVKHLVRKISEKGEIAEGKMYFDHYAFGVDFQIQTSADDSCIVQLDEVFKSDNIYFKSILAYLQTAHLQTFRTEVRALALNELNRVVAAYPDWARLNSKFAHKYLTQKNCCCLLEMVTDKENPSLIGICAIWDPLYYSLPLYISWADGDSMDVSRTEYRQYPLYVHDTRIFHIEDISEIKAKEENMENTDNCVRLLKRLLPGDWSKNHASKLVNRQLGGSRFSPMFIPTSEVEVQAIVPYLNAEMLNTKRGLDPCCGVSTIINVLGANQIVSIEGNDINPHLKDVTSFDALRPVVYQTIWRDKYDFSITSPPFDMLDIIVPMLVATFEFSLIHLPATYVTDGCNQRHRWLAVLAQQKRLKALNVTYARNDVLGRYCIWMAFAKTEK